jgi:hypothetical protein
MSCPICINKYNKSTCAQVKCECNYSACKSCVRTYLLTTTKEPHCMNCRVKWSPEFTKNAVGATFLNKEYREHKTKQLIDQVVARREQYIAEALLYRDERDDKAAIVELTKNIQTHNYPKNSKELIQIQENIEDIQNRINIRNRKPLKFRNPLRGFLYFRENRQEHQSHKFIMACPSSECNGMLAEDYCCKVCFKIICSKCLEPELENHICNPDIVASRKAINKESKPCPKCACPISKIDGCDQMWCVLCRTAFSWITGNIETEHIHNPHYYQFMREQAAKQEVQEEDIPRQCSIRDDALQWLFRRLQLNIKDEQIPLNYMIDYIKYTNHISEVTIVQLEQKINNDNINKYIYQYILGEINKPTLGTKLYLNKCAEEKNTLFIDIYKAIPMITNHLCYNIINEQLEVELLYNMFQKYSTYSNNELLKLIKLYNTKQQVELFK